MPDNDVDTYEEILRTGRFDGPVADASLDTFDELAENQEVFGVCTYVNAALNADQRIRPTISEADREVYARNYASGDLIVVEIPSFIEVARDLMTRKLKQVKIDNCWFEQAIDRNYGAGDVLFSRMDKAPVMKFADAEVDEQVTLWDVTIYDRHEDVLFADFVAVRYGE